jgi:hypothetical protein
VVEKKYRFALITRFQKFAKEKGIDSNINIYAEQWTADALIQSYTLETCYEMISYYFYVSENPSWKWFANNADKVYKNLTARKEDDRIRALMRDRAKEWLDK